MYPWQERKVQGNESNKCNYPKSLILFYEFLVCFVFEAHFSIQIMSGIPHRSWLGVEFKTSGKRRDGNGGWRVDILTCTVAVYCLLPLLV